MTKIKHKSVLETLLALTIDNGIKTNQKVTLKVKGCYIGVTLSFVIGMSGNTYVYYFRVDGEEGRVTKMVNWCVDELGEVNDFGGVTQYDWNIYDRVNEAIKEWFEGTGNNGIIHR